MNTAATISPDSSGPQPNPSWSISGSRNGTELTLRR